MGSAVSWCVPVCILSGVEEEISIFRQLHVNHMCAAVRWLRQHAIGNQCAHLHAEMKRAQHYTFQFIEKSNGIEVLINGWLCQRVYHHDAHYSHIYEYMFRAVRLATSAIIGIIRVYNGYSARQIRFIAVHIPVIHLTYESAHHDLCGCWVIKTYFNYRVSLIVFR